MHALREPRTSTRLRAVVGANMEERIGGQDGSVFSQATRRVSA